MSSDADRQSVEQADKLVEAAAEAQKTLAGYSQEQIDRIVGAMARAALEHAYRLGEMAHTETGYGIPSDKEQKNRFSAENVYNFIKPMRTVGVIRETESIVEVASPRGVIAAIIPSTNPTSTAIFKILISIKARNAVVLSPHPSATNCINETARVMREAGEAVGLPKGTAACLTHSTIEATQELMKHKRTALILATGGLGLVRAAYSSGKPAFGVGPGNVPAMIERSAAITKAVKDILTGKCFDNGTICSSEQAVVVEKSVDREVREAFARLGGHFLGAEEQDSLSKVVVTPNTTLNTKIVGKSARAIAEMAGISLPGGVRAMLCRPGGVGREHPLSMEKLSPILAYYVVEDLSEGCDVCAQILRYGGMGHTASIHTRSRDAAREFGVRMPASRIIVSSPSTHGAIGFTTDLEPSMTLGCGSWGGNVTSDNISPRHLMDIKRIAFETHPINVETASTGAESARRSAAGVGGGGASGAAGASASRDAIESLVARFLAERRISGKRTHPAAPAAHASEPPAANWSSESDPTPRPTQPEPVTEPSAAPPLAPKTRTVAESNGSVYDFVCEDDVKRAIASGQKIYINSKTIITPAARDVGNDRDVFARKD